MEKHVTTCSRTGITTEWWTPTEAEIREAVASSLSHMSGGWDLAEQQARPRRLHDLYVADGRHHPHHPMAGLFTGLVVGMPETFAPVEEG